MKHLVIYAHPNPKSFNSAIRDVVIEELKKAEKDIMLRDLYDLNFNPILSCDDFMKIQQCTAAPDVLKEQEFVKEAGTLIFIYPLWWSSMPAILKGYIDRVFSYGFAYEVKETGTVGLLKGKRAFLITTTGATEEMNTASGLYNAMGRVIDGSLEFTGLKIVGHLYLAAVPYVTDEVRKGMLEIVRSEIQEKLL